MFLWGKLCQLYPVVALVEKNLPGNAGDIRDMSSIPGLGFFPGRERQPTLAFLPEESHGQRNVVGYTP